MHVEQLWLFLRTSKRRPLRQIAARHLHLRQGRNGVTLSGDALPHELDQVQRETLAVGQPVEQHVQDVQDLRKVGLVKNTFIRQVEAAKAEEADINLLCGARGMKFVIRFRRLDELMKHR